MCPYVRYTNIHSNLRNIVSFLKSDMTFAGSRMHCAGLEGEDADPHELFVALGVLVVEGRVPGASDRGYGEGPHCPALGAKQRATLPHKCDTLSNLLVSKIVRDLFDYTL